MRLVFTCLSLLLAFTPSAGPRSRAAAQDNTHAEVLALQKAERWVAQGKSGRAVRALARLLREPSKAPNAAHLQDSDALLVRYAELALPFTLPEGEAQQKARSLASELFLAALARRAQREDALPSGLALAAAWGEALLGNYGESQALLARYARADDPRSLACLRAVVALALRAEQTSVARSVLNLARGLVSSEAALADELSMVELAEGDTETALIARAERFARDPSSLLVGRDPASTLGASARPAAGFAFLAVLAGGCNNDPSCLQQDGRWAFAAGLIGEALVAARVLLEREPEHLDGLFLAADALVAQGELDQARLMYQTILRIVPGNLRAIHALLELDDSVNGSSLRTLGAPAASDGTGPR